MWKWTQENRKSLRGTQILLFGGLGRYGQPERDVTVVASLEDGISLAVDTVNFGHESINLTRQQTTDLIALLTEALEVTKEITT
jgi:hypothetical protein